MTPYYIRTNRKPTGAKLEWSRNSFVLFPNTSDSFQNPSDPFYIQSLKEMLSAFESGWFRLVPIMHFSFQ